MKKNLQTKTDTALILKKSNKLLGITKKILSDKLVLKKTTDIALNNKIWQDPDTGLSWQVEIENKKYSWYETFECAKKLSAKNYGGYSDWRVPNRDELMTILTEESFKDESTHWGVTFIKEPLLQSVIDSSSGFYWSSDEYDEFAWSVYFGNGFDYDMSKDDKHYVRCVR